MTKDFKAPQRIEVVNKGKIKDCFVPYRENEKFPLESGEKISFFANDSEQAIYYVKQSMGNIYAANCGEFTVEAGSYDLETAKFETEAPFTTVLKESSAEEVKYEVIGTLPYSEATPALGLIAGNRFTCRISNPKVDFEHLPGGKICSCVVKVGEETITSNEYNKNAFEEDGSLVVIINAIPECETFVEIKWSNEETIMYSFTFKNSVLGAEGESFEALKCTEVALPQTVKISNISEQPIAFVPYKENFSEVLGVEGSVTLTCKKAEEALYYLLQANEAIKVELV